MWMRHDMVAVNVFTRQKYKQHNNNIIVFYVLDYIIIYDLKQFYFTYTLYIIYIIILQRTAEL